MARMWDTFGHRIFNDLKPPNEAQQCAAYIYVYRFCESRQSSQVLGLRAWGQVDLRKKRLSLTRELNFARTQHFWRL